MSSSNSSASSSKRLVREERLGGCFVEIALFEGIVLERLGCFRCRVFLLLLTPESQRCGSLCGASNSFTTGYGLLSVAAFTPRLRAGVRAISVQARLVVRHVAEAQREHLRDAVEVHRDAVDVVRDLHRPPVVRHHDELRLLRECLERLREAADVRLVERGIDFVEDAEGRRVHGQQREEQRDRRERPLAAGEQRQAADPLAGGLASMSMPVSAGLSGSVIRSWAVPPPKNDGKYSPNDLFTTAKAATKRVRISSLSSRDRLAKLRLGLFEVGDLLREEVVPFARLAVVLGRLFVDRAEPADALAKVLDANPRLFEFDRGRALQRRRQRWRRTAPRWRAPRRSGTTAPVRSGASPSRSISMRRFESDSLQRATSASSSSRRRCDREQRRLGRVQLVLDLPFVRFEAAQLVVVGGAIVAGRGLRRPGSPASSAASFASRSSIAAPPASWLRSRTLRSLICPASRWSERSCCSRSACSAFRSPSIEASREPASETARSDSSRRARVARSSSSSAGMRRAALVAAHAHLAGLFGGGGGFRSRCSRSRTASRWRARSCSMSRRSRCSRSLLLAAARRSPARSGGEAARTMASASFARAASWSIVWRPACELLGADLGALAAARRSAGELVEFVLAAELALFGAGRAAGDDAVRLDVGAVERDHAAERAADHPLPGGDVLADDDAAEERVDQRPELRLAAHELRRDADDALLLLTCSAGRRGGRRRAGGTGRGPPRRRWSVSIAASACASVSTTTAWSRCSSAALIANSRPGGTRIWRASRPTMPVNLRRLAEAARGDAVDQRLAHDEDVARPGGDAVVLGLDAPQRVEAAFELVQFAQFGLVRCLRRRAPRRCTRREPLAGLLARAPARRRSATRPRRAWRAARRSGARSR